MEISIYALCSCTKFNSHFMIFIVITELFNVYNKPSDSLSFLLRSKFSLILKFIVYIEKVIYF